MIHYLFFLKNFFLSIKLKDRTRNANHSFLYHIPHVLFFLRNTAAVTPSSLCFTKYFSYACLWQADLGCSRPHQTQTCSDSGMKSLFWPPPSHRTTFVCSKTVLSVPLADLTPATCCHSAHFFILFTSLLWPRNNITSLPYISPTTTSISAFSGMTQRSVPLVRGLVALTVNIPGVLCIGH